VPCETGGETEGYLAGAPPLGLGPAAAIREAGRRAIRRESPESPENFEEYTMSSTLLKSIASAMILATSCVLPGCISTNGIDESDGARADEAAAVEGETGEAEMALDPEAGNLFRLKVKHTGMCIEPVGDVDGVPLVQKECTCGLPEADDAQSFRKVVTGDGTIRLKHEKTGLYVYIAGPSMDNGGIAVLLTYDATRLNGRFAVGAPDLALFHELKVVDSGRCAAIVGAFHGDNVALYQWGASCVGDHQKFMFDYGDPCCPW
jgi:hypothetical protein